MHKRLKSIMQKGTLYALALVLAAGYPASVMADTQEPVNPVSSVEVSSEPAAQEQTQAQVVNEPTEVTIIEPETPAQAAESTTGNSTESSQDTTVDTNVKVDTQINSDATSGDSTVGQNTKAGDATTGSAQAAATVLNNVNSTIGTGANQKVATFTQDILGDVKGDIILYPMLLKAMLEAKAEGTGQNPSTTVNAATNFDINNTINLNAASGNAKVTENTVAGNATTGSATAVANVVNILNSMIAAQDSFIGTINIYGNLEGDILIAPDFIPQLIANNGETSAEDLKVSKQDTTSIVNNITAVAESGAASVFGNTAAGNAKTGDALSNVVIFNVSGHEVVAKNSLLVFVNVLGTWVGMIVDAPASATAGMVGSDVTKNSTYTPDLTVNAQSNHGITNTIAVTAQSGDAEVSYNTQAGNAVTGSAKAMANVANVSASQFSMSDWFGVLFINVFQSWHGSFGIDTAYGNVIKDETPRATGPIQFIPTDAPRTEERPRVTLSMTTRTTPITPLSVVTVSSEDQAVLAQSTKSSDAPKKSTVKSERAPVQESYDYRMLIIAASLLVIGASALGIRRLLQ